MKDAGARLRIVLGCFCANMVTHVPIVSSTFGVFLKPITQSLGWPRTAFSVILLIVAVVGFICYPIAGRAADKYGVRRVAMAGTFCFGLSVAALSMLGSSKIVMYSLYGLAGGAATFCSVVVLSKAIAMWFRSNRGLLFGLTNACGVNAGSAITPILAAWLIARFGWHLAYLAMGLVVIAVGLTATSLLAAPKTAMAATAPSIDAAEPPSSGTIKDAERHRAYWPLLIAIAVGAGSLSALSTHTVPLLTDRSVSIKLATTAFAVKVLASAGWQLVLGLILDRRPSPRAAGVMMLISLLGFFLLGTATQQMPILAGAAVLGMGIGTEYAMLPICVSRYFGPQVFSSLYGRILGLSVLVSGICPVFMDMVFDKTGNYGMAMIGFGAAVACSGVLMCCLPAYAGKGRSGPLGDAALVQPGVA